MSLSFRLASTKDDITACHRLRWAVFVVEQGVPEADENDGTDVGSTHVMAEEKGELVGVARFHRDGDMVKISRVCVSREARGKGLGAALIEQVCARSGAATAKLGAQASAIPFYQQLGFEAVGAPYHDAGIPHQDMTKALL